MCLFTLFPFFSAHLSSASELPSSSPLSLSENACVYFVCLTAVTARLDFSAVSLPTVQIASSQSVLMKEIFFQIII